MAAETTEPLSGADEVFATSARDNRTNDGGEGPTMGERENSRRRGQYRTDEDE